ncbi:Bug family tripartite tricarboxylate transporter substrate binding protein [Phreatobacter oligotrophus]|uniref:Tripartite-type tricarboxylate transporter receptor subunit TctC n=1 Tax=Phreatobacter oligotrophus TaxID=1122261 RepID=A0A2T4YY63_9HYPH|nr:tripartite tricarboxylate transporter substrate binding protein [Phreatobacter oligotrophus]PTM51490.1 tripartite-type tricarboxylate transporter receptor subunit TctC [Phreatobacter oligotrophus]
MTELSRREALAAVAGLTALGFGTAPANAQLGPGRTLTLMVPYPAGGLSDAIARNLQPAFQRVLGQTVLVENLGGASGGLAAQKLLQTRADGRMIFQGSPNELILSPLVNPDIKFRPDQFRHVTQITRNPLILLVRPDHPASNIDELVAHAKAQGRPTPYGSVGVGSLYHVLSEEMAKQTGIRVTHVAYRGAAPVLQDLASGQIDFAILPFATSYKPLQDQKKLKMLGWVSKSRVDFLPDLVAFGESKVLPNFDHSIWAGIFVRSETPEDIVQRLNEAVGEVMRTPEVRTAISNTGSIVVDATSLAEARRFYEDQVRVLDAMTREISFRV